MTRRPIGSCTAAFAGPAKEVEMAEYTPAFSLAVEGVKGACPAGEAYAKQERKEVARQVADKIIERLQQEGHH